MGPAGNWRSAPRQHLLHRLFDQHKAVRIREAVIRPLHQGQADIRAFGAIQQAMRPIRMKMERAGMAPERQRVIQEAVRKSAMDHMANS